MDAQYILDRLRGRAPIVLACVIWVANALIVMAVFGHFTWLILIWAVHGLILMVAMKAILDRANAIPSRYLRIGIALTLPIAFTILQSVASLASALLASGGPFSSLAMFASRLFEDDIVVRSARSESGRVFVFIVNMQLNFQSYIWLYGFYAATISLLRAMQTSYEARLDAQEARLDALRLQLSPHFLFNALNSLSALVGTGRSQDAEAMIGRLSDFYRSNLLASDVDLAPLDQELDAIADYLEIEHVRFGDRLKISFDVADEVAGADVPRLILQPLVENAMKHGVSRSSAPIEIRVSAHARDGRLLLGVANDLPAGSSTVAASGTGSGLSNIRRRLNTLYGSRAEMMLSGSTTEWRAVISLPLSRPD